MTLLTNSPSDRVMAFIDLANIRASVNFPGFTVDLYSICHEIVGNRKLVAAYVFDARPDDGSIDTNRALHRRLSMIGFRVITRDSLNTATKQQKEVDVAMACEMVVHALRDHYDVALVVSGDRDFVPAVQHVQDAGKIVEVAAFENAFSSEMKRVADYYHSLDGMPVITVTTWVKKPEEEDAESEEQTEEENNDESS